MIEVDQDLVDEKTTPVERQIHKLAGRPVLVPEILDSTLAALKSSTTDKDLRVSRKILVSTQGAIAEYLFQRFAKDIGLEKKKGEGGDEAKLIHALGDKADEALGVLISIIGERFGDWFDEVIQTTPTVGVFLDTYFDNPANTFKAFAKFVGEEPNTLYDRLKQALFLFYPVNGIATDTEKAATEAVTDSRQASPPFEIHA